MDIFKKSKRFVFASQFLAVAGLPSAINAAPIQFDDTSDALGFYRGTESWGIAWGNLNGDEYPDIYNNGHRDYTRMYRNTGTGDFEDVSMEYDHHMDYFWLGNTMRDVHGAAWGDYDKDGDDDLLVGDEYDFFINNADSGGFFTHTTPSSLGQAHTAWKPTNGGRDISYITRYECQGNISQFIDADNDGDLDYACVDEDRFPEDGSSSAVSDRVPFMANVLDTALGDFNNDLKQDIIVLRGGLRPNGASKISDTEIDGWFRYDSGSGFTFSATGQVTFLIDGDGGGAYLDEDVLVLNTNGNTSGTVRGISISYSGGQWRVQDNNSDAGYVRVRAENPVSNPVMFGLTNRDEPQNATHLVNTDSGFEAVYNTGLATPFECRTVVTADFDNDMDLDLYMGCGAGVDNKVNRYFDNNGDGTFTEVSSHGGEGPVGPGNEFGIAEAAVVADYDVDGFVDLAVVNGLLFYPFGFGGPDNLFRNKGNGNHWIEIDLNGVTSNGPGLGAKVYVTAGGVTQMREQNGGYHRWAQNHQRLHFGLAGNTTIDEIRIEWPAGQVDVYTNVSADQLYNAIEARNLEPAVLGPEVKTEIADGEECGVPQYTSTYGPMIQIWRDCGTDTWHLRSRSGLARLIENVPQVTAGTISGSRNIGAATPINFTGVDTFTNAGGVINFETLTNDTYGNNKTINFSTANQSTMCIDFSQQDIDAIIIGSTGKKLKPPFDILNDFGPCDSDGDGIGDATDPDDDNDGVLDVDDAFPLDPTEWSDTDGDGVGDNTDLFPTDPTEAYDSDLDGVGDNADAFPNDPSESSDSDGDGVGDNSDAFPNDPTETSDTDGDGVGDNSDADIDNDGLVDSAETIAGSAEDVVLDSFESNQGWTRNPYNTDNASTGVWEIGNPEGTSYWGNNIQLNNTTSGSSALVTGLSGGQSGSNDIDGGVTTILSPMINLSPFATTLKFNYYLSHWSNASSSDYFRVSIVAGGNTQAILTDLASGSRRSANWTAFSTNISGYAGQSIQLLVEAADNGSGSLVEAAMDDISVTVNTPESTDQDGDGIVNERDLDSDGDTIPDVVEAGLSDADGNYIVDDLVNDQGSVSNAPDSDGDGLPDFLDAESSNPNNDGTAYDIANTVYAAFDTNGDGKVNALDTNGGVDADGDGIDDLVDSDPTNPGSGPAPTDSDGDGVPDTQDAYPTDATRTVPEVSIGSASVAEATGSVTLQVSLSVAPRVPASVLVSTSDGSASGGSDYLTLNQQVSFAIGQTSQSVSVTILDDTTAESNETFSVGLSSLVSLTAGSSATVSIQDDDNGNVSDACYEPVFDRFTEAGVFLWDTCDGSGEWRMRVTGGGNADGVFYEGNIEATQALTYTGYSIEGHDVLTAPSPEVLAFVLKTWNAAEDGLNFTPGTGACLTVNDVDLPMYLGQNRVEVDSPLNLTTLEACDVAPPAEECGMPTFDSATEEGLFLWKDCVLGEWSATLSGGGNPAGVQASGSVTSVGGFSSTAQDSFEPNDVFDNTTNPDEIVYLMKVWNAARDSFSFTANGANACLILDQDIPIYLGENKQLTASPLNLDTLESCDIAPEPAQCGAPSYDNGTEPGLYLWQDCDAVTADAQWQMHVVGGGLAWSPYSGLISSSLPLVATGDQLENSDIVDATVGDNNIDFMLYIANRGIDALNITVPSGSQTCFTTSTIPSGAQVYIGRDKQVMTDPFNLEDLGACQ
ncbi:ASPIC/UnbV domain-containing protein [Halioxenophilus aromaticivorans]|uniref:MAM domain-containing protein n=1 Tax=Halioxenophilus aromaticivorans TaxID=1306992 RepID=A0AAV3U3R7_9ALTE